MIYLLDIQRRHQFFRGREVSCRCVRTIQVLETCRQFLVKSLSSALDWILDLPADSLCGDHDVARGAFHPPASKARPAVGGEGLLRCPSVGISVRDLYWHHDI
jgi:hypothetical protein